MTTLNPWDRQAKLEALLVQATQLLGEQLAHDPADDRQWWEYRAAKLREEIATYLR
jgi:hypothetical protein